MDRPQAEIDGCGIAHHRLRAVVGGLGDTDLARASRLPSWSVGHVASLPDRVWGRPVRTVAGGEHPAALLPFRRWREVEVHLVDLGCGVDPDEWSDGLVRRALPQLVADLSDRADHRQLMAWLLGRGPAPGLGPWG